LYKKNVITLLHYYTILLHKNYFEKVEFGRRMRKSSAFPHATLVQFSTQQIGDYQ